MDNKIKKQIIDILINKIKDRYECTSKQAELLLYHSLTFNLVQAEILNQIDFILESE